MNLLDGAGYPVSGANPDALAVFETAAHELRCFIGDPVATVDRALACSPEMVMAHMLKAYLHLLGTEPAGIRVARACHAAAAGLPANDRERWHLHAVSLLCAGRWRAAGSVLEDLSAAYPRDALALQAGHQIDFFTGESRQLRDRVARVLPAWSPGVPGYHAVLGMHAFGLEETGDYAGAERQGRASIELERRDGWGWHAVAHVMEMTHRPRAGIAWLRGDVPAWSERSFFAVHNWWHLALYHLELDEVDEVLRLFDGALYGHRSGVVLDMIDASALLWRLHLRGVNVGARWEALAANWASIATAGNYAFNDMHAMMAFVGADRPRAQAALLEAQREAMRGEGDNAAFTAEVGHAAVQAIRAFGEGDYPRTVKLLQSIRGIAHRFGGSHAQRDVIDLTLVAAASRAGEGELAAALAVERRVARRDGPWVLRDREQRSPAARVAVALAN
ncbi:MAG TPA: tetratricopeptide repeat protein [Burkholderiales bacterium]|nr:tetratricopeptide repeat protein [Burkholderiales bacterium]